MRARKPILAALAALALLSVPVRAEQQIVTLCEPGLALGDLSVRYYVGGASAAAPGGLAVTELDGGDQTTDYLVTGLPDAAAGSSTWYRLVVEDPSGCTYPVQWPELTRTPQAIVWAPVYELAPGSADIRAGDTLPSVRLTLRGLPADATGATVTFTLYKQTNGQATAIANRAATVVSSTEVVDPITSASTWTAVLDYAWRAADTGTTAGAGTYYGQFKVTFSAATCGTGSDACIVTAPPRNQAQIRIW